MSLTALRDVIFDRLVAVGRWPTISKSRLAPIQDGKGLELRVYLRQAVLSERGSAWMSAPEYARDTSIQVDLHKAGDWNEDLDGALDIEVDAVLAAIMTDEPTIRIFEGAPTITVDYEPRTEPGFHGVDARLEFTFRDHLEFPPVVTDDLGTVAVSGSDENPFPDATFTIEQEE